MNLAYKISIICGIVPLAVGSAIFILWLITRLDWFMMAGVFTIYGGLIVFLLGVISLVLYCRLGFRNPNTPRRHLWKSTIASAGLLLFNFPVAGAYVYTAVDIATSYTVVIHNVSPYPLENVFLSGGGCEESIKVIPPHGRAKCTFRFKADGTLTFRASLDSRLIEETIEGYVTGNLGGHAVITINKDGSPISH